MNTKTARTYRSMLPRSEARGTQSTIGPSSHCKAELIPHPARRVPETIARSPANYLVHRGPNPSASLPDVPELEEVDHEEADTVHE
jgi:hypothetical protein